MATFDAGIYEEILTELENADLLTRIADVVIEGGDRGRGVLKANIRTAVVRSDDPTRPLRSIEIAIEETTNGTDFRLLLTHDNDTIPFVFRVSDAITAALVAQAFLFGKGNPDTLPGPPDKEIPRRGVPGGPPSE